MSTRQLFSIILILAIFSLSVKVAEDPDLWWHLRTGAYILENGIPHEDPSFSFTAAGRPWITHEWLTEVMMISVYRQFGGLNGLSILFAGFTALTFGLLYYASDGRPYLAGLATLWGVVASLPLISARPQILNILFGAMIIFVVEMVKKRGWSQRWFWLIPLLLMLWVNMHGGYLLGLVIIGVYVVGETAQLWLHGGHPEGLSRPALMTLAGAGIAGTLAALVNPNGIEMWFYAFETLSSDAMRQAIDEWRSPNFHLWYMWLFGSMLLATWGIMIFSRKPVIWTDILFVVGTSYAALQSIRNIPLFALVAVPIMSRHLVGLFEDRQWPLLSENRPAPYTPPLLKGVNLFLLAAIIIGIGFYMIDTLSETEDTLREFYPVDAVAYIKAEGLDQNRIYNDYAWGGYLIWHEVPAFIDGRADLYGDEFLFQYLTLLGRGEGWDDALVEHKVDTILTNQQGSFAYFIGFVPGWEKVYEDDIAVIFAKTAK